jgi:hypothetical protein
MAAATTTFASAFGRAPTRLVVLLILLVTACSAEGEMPTGTSSAARSSAQVWASLCEHLRPMGDQLANGVVDASFLEAIETDAGFLADAGDQQAAAHVRDLARALDQIGPEQQVNIYFDDPVERQVVRTVLARARRTDGVVEVWFESKAAAYRRALRMFADLPNVDGFDPAAIPASVRAVTAPDADVTALVERSTGTHGVRDVVVEPPDPEMERVWFASAYFRGKCEGTLTAPA